MEYTKIKLRRDIQINWNRVNPVLESGEIGIITDINKFKIGDGITSFVILPFATYNADELDLKFQNIQTQIDEIGGAELKERISAVEGKVEQNTNDITAIKGAGYLNSEQVNAIINGKDYATNTRVNEVENKIPSDTVTSAELQAVETIANSKTTLEEVNQQGFVKNSELATVAKTGSYNDLSDKPTIPEGVVVDKELNINSDNAISNKAVTTKINSMDSEIASKTTMGEVEAKGYQDSTQVEQAINAKGYTTLDEVAQQGYAQNSDIPTDNNQLNNGADYQTGAQVEQTITSKNYTTISEVEGKGYQNSEQVESAINAKEYVPKSQFATINSQSITDGGNIEIQGGGGADITIDDAIIGNSTNPVENGKIADKLYEIENNIPKVDSEEWVFTMEDGSTINRNMSLTLPNSFYVEDISGEENQLSLNSVDVSVIPVLKYTLDNGNTWVSWAEPYTTPITFGANKKVYLKGTNVSINGSFNCTKNYKVGGDLTSILEESGNVLDIQTKNYILSEKFKDSATLIDASDLILPSTILSDFCYKSLFQDCTNLKYSPKVLPAESIGLRSYSSMYKNCYNLITTPQINATSSYYNAMEDMFNSCSKIESAPIFKIEGVFCSDGLFAYCQKLKKIEISTTYWNKDYSFYWVTVVAKEGVFIKPKELVVGDGYEQIPIGVHGIPAGWTIIDK